jgi:hypothetical protein
MQSRQKLGFKRIVTCCGVLTAWLLHLLAMSIFGLCVLSVGYFGRFIDYGKGER